MLQNISLLSKTLFAATSYSVAMTARSALLPYVQQRSLPSLHVTLAPLFRYLITNIDPSSCVRCLPYYSDGSAGPTTHGQIYQQNFRAHAQAYSMLIIKRYIVSYT